MAVKLISRAAGEAFACGRNFSGGNTEVRHEDGRSFMRLHGSLIAVKTVDGKVMLSFAGWYSRTTKDRLQGVLNALGVDGIFKQIKNRMYLVRPEEKEVLGYVHRDKKSHWVGSRFVEYTETAKGIDHGFFEVA